MSKLFEPLNVGASRLQHRLVMAPLTRYRADDAWLPTELMKEYYVQRASVPGTLLLTEATTISPEHIGRDMVPGIWNDEQVAGWKIIVDAVHAKGCFIWCQLWAQGRTATAAVVNRLGHKLYAPSAIPATADGQVPVEMTEGDIQSTIEAYRSAAINAIKAGFDGVEVHAGNGYLPDQFLQPASNLRSDKWGGSVENRARFPIEVMKAINGAIGAQRAALRLSPWSDYNSMGMEDPVPQFKYVVEQLRPMGLGFLDLIEARIRGNDDADCGVGQDVSFLVKTWQNVSPVLLSGGFTPESARVAVEETYKDFDVGIMFGRHWTSNPDLVFRIKEDLSLQKYDRPTFYTPGTKKGYVDWAFSDTFQQQTVI